MSSVVASDTPLVDKPAPSSAKHGLGSRATSKVTFRDGDNKAETRLSDHPAESEARPTSLSKSLSFHQAQPLPDLKKKEEINPFKFSADVDFCALSQRDKREKAEVNYFEEISSN